MGLYVIFGFHEVSVLRERVTSAELDLMARWLIVILGKLHFCMLLWSPWLSLWDYCGSLSVQALLCNEKRDHEAERLQGKSSEIFLVPS